MILRVYIQCVRHRKPRADPRKLTNDSIQQSGTYVQQAYAIKTVNGRSRAVFKKCITDDGNINPDSSFFRSSNRSKCTITRPIIQEDICPFSISIFLSFKRFEVVFILC